MVKPTERTELLLGPLEDGSSEVLMIKIPLSAPTYRLVENRQPVGFDRHLPGHGVLVMHADDTIAECRRGQAPVKLVNADPTVPRLEGAAFDFPQKTTFVDGKNGLRITLLEKRASAATASASSRSRGRAIPPEPLRARRRECSVPGDPSPVHARTLGPRSVRASAQVPGLPERG